MEDWEQELSKLEPALAQQIRTAASRAGLQAHDPAARMIAEMWVAVAALRGERKQLQQDLVEMRRMLGDNRRYLLWILTLVSALLLASLVGWL